MPEVTASFQPPGEIFGLVMTWFATVDRRSALVICLALAGLIGFGAHKVQSDSFFNRKAYVEDSQDTGRHRHDIDFYRTVVKRISAGEAYYQVLAGELRADHYQSGSLFAWRSPALLWTIAKLSPGVARVVLVSLAVIGILLAYPALRKEAPWISAPTILSVALAMLPYCIEPSLFFADSWCGIFLFIGATLVAKEQLAIAAMFCTLALFMREHALLAMILALGLCVKQRRWKALHYWLVGLAVWGLYYGWHISHVLALIGPADSVRQQSWLQFGGWPFVLATAQVYPPLAASPPWVSAVVFPVGVLGLIGWKNAEMLFARLVALGYIAAFLVVGYYPMNFYWGLIYLPMWSLGFITGGAALVDLLRPLPRPSPLSRR